MGQYDVAQLVTLAESVGLNPAQAAIAAAVAMAESGGNASAPHSDNAPGQSGCTSAGLWQVQYCPSRDAPNSIRAQVHNNPTDVNLSAQAMKQISNSGANFNPWTTFTTNDPKRSYQQFYPAAKAAAAGANTDAGGAVGGPNWDPTGGAIAGAASDVGKSITGAVSSLSDVLDVLKVLTAAATWYRVGLFLLGLVAAIFGLVIIERDTLEPAAAIAAL